MVGHSSNTPEAVIEMEQTRRVPCLAQVNRAKVSDHKQCGAVNMGCREPGTFVSYHQLPMWPFRSQVVECGATEPP